MRKSFSKSSERDRIASFEVSNHPLYDTLLDLLLFFDLPEQRYDDDEFEAHCMDLVRSRAADLTYEEATLVLYWWKTRQNLNKKLADSFEEERNAGIMRLSASRDYRVDRKWIMNTVMIRAGHGIPTPEGNPSKPTRGKPKK